MLLCCHRISIWRKRNERCVNLSTFLFLSKHVFWAAFCIHVELDLDLRDNYNLQQSRMGRVQTRCSVLKCSTQVQSITSIHPSKRDGEERRQMKEGRNEGRVHEHYQLRLSMAEGSWLFAAATLQFDHSAQLAAAPNVTAIRAPKLHSSAEAALQTTRPLMSPVTELHCPDVPTVAAD
jgi:hypothetical protein